MKNEEYLSIFGPVQQYSPGTGMVMADRQIKRAIEKGSAHLDEIGNLKAVVTFRPTGKWFMLRGGWGNDDVRTVMLGAACGDVAGSVYEWHNIKYKPDPNRLIQPHARFTDDTVMTCAVANGIYRGLSQLPENWMSVPDAEALLFRSIQDSLLQYGRRYPNAGYGGAFRAWLVSEHPSPYHSWGNGSAMRVSYAGWAASSLEEAEKLAELSAKITHDHPDAVIGAKVVAGCIFHLRSGASKQDIYNYASSFYDLDFSLGCI